MHILLYILLGIVAVIVIILLLALVRRKDYYVEREIIINKPVATVFDYVRHLKNQDHYNKWVMADPNMQKTFKGTDGMPGFVYGWNGNKQAGEGELELKAIHENKVIETEIRFVRPFVSMAYADIITEPAGADQTKVRWTNKSTMKYPMNAMLPMVEKMLGKDMDSSLVMLKGILER